MASIYGGGFDRLDMNLQKSILSSLRHRRANYVQGLAGVRWDGVAVILVGDRPGNGAKKLPANHHHTPFYSTKNSSLWLNKLLVEAGFHENSFFWINSADLHGTPSSYHHLEHWNNPRIIALGGNASKWLGAGGYKHEQVWHPQAWKRFRNAEPYPLIDMLRETLDLQKA